MMGGKFYVGILRKGHRSNNPGGFDDVLTFDKAKPAKAFVKKIEKKGYWASYGSPYAGKKRKR